MVNRHIHYNDVTMGAIASQITSLTIVYWFVYSDADQRKHQSSASLAFVRGNSPGTGEFRGRVNSLHKWSVTRTMFSLHNVIMTCATWRLWLSDQESTAMCLWPRMHRTTSIRFSWHDVYVYNIGSKIYLPLPDVRFYKYEGNFAGLKHLVFKYHVSCEFFTE